jgi:hypothetical protein
MLNVRERRSLFVLFCIFTTVCVVVEIGLIYEIVEKGFTNTKVLSAAAVLFAIGQSFVRLVNKTFLESRELLPEVLQRSASERCNIIDGARHSNEDVYLTRQKLVTNTLKFSEQALNGWVKGSHFEFCLFVDREQPLLFAYFDSHHDVAARSMVERERNPFFYVESGYEVTRLMQAPTSQPRIIKDTTDSTTNYVYTSSHQRNQIKATILLCPDVRMPCALVITSNEKNAFSDTDSDVMSFIRYVCETVRYDLMEGDFIGQIRRYRPTLFREPVQI